VFEVVGIKITLMRVKTSQRIKNKTDE
jgi:hypothetical protein